MGRILRPYFDKSVAWDELHRDFAAIGKPSPKGVRTFALRAAGDDPSGSDSPDWQDVLSELAKELAQDIAAEVLPGLGKRIVNAVLDKYFKPPQSVGVHLAALDEVAAVVQQVVEQDTIDKYLALVNGARDKLLTYKETMDANLLDNNLYNLFDIMSLLRTKGLKTLGAYAMAANLHLVAILAKAETSGNGSYMATYNRKRLEYHGYVIDMCNAMVDQIRTDTELRTPRCQMESSGGSAWWTMGGMPPVFLTEAKCNDGRAVRFQQRVDELVARNVSPIVKAANEWGTDASNQLVDGCFTTISTRFDWYLNTPSGTGPAVQVVNRHHPDPAASDEIWWIERVGGRGKIESGDEVFIRTRSSWYLNTPSGTGPAVQVVNRHHPDPAASDEIWWIERSDGPGVVKAGDRVFIRTRANYYLNAASGTGPGVLVVSGHSTDPAASDEMWKVNRLG